MSQKIEDHPLTVGRDIEGHPGALFRLKVDVTCVTSR